MKKLFQNLFGAILFCTAFVQPTFAQVMDPNDPVIEYTGGNIQQPNWGQVADWVKTTRLNWNTDEYKCYIFEGHIFRLKFPKTYQHNVNDGKTYPMFIFFHGLGESGNENMYDNEYQLFHGGQLHRDSVNSGAFDGFLLYMQNQYGFFGDAHFDMLSDLINNFLVPQNKLDINRIFVDGLSGGGGATWDFTLRYPRLVAGCMPISASLPAYGNNANANILRYIPIWVFQGGRDNNPAPATTQGVVTNLLNAGANLKYTVYPNRGHSCWYDAWGEKDFHPFMLRHHKANPIPLGRKYEFCAGENVSLTLGLSAGFDGYQWRKNGVVIPGATSNTLVLNGSQAATFGTYDCRIRRGTVWSVWSPTPVVVKLKDPTNPPDIQAPGMSNVIPSPDGNNNVILREPSNFLTYAWQRVGNPATLGTDSSLTVSTPGDYVVKVTEEFGCLSNNSAVFKVVNANGPNKPVKAGNLIVSPVSLTQLKLDWSDDPFPDFNETKFEIFQGTAAGGPYAYIGKTGQDTTTFTVTGLAEGTRYYYIIRAVNNTGAAPVSDEASGTTVPDNTAPTAPGNLRILTSSNNSVSLVWNASTDNIAVTKYNIYIDGVKSYVTTATSFTCYNLTVADSGYVFKVTARDAAENESAFSNQVLGLPPAIIPALPAAASNLVATAVSYKRINLTWTDNSNNETGFELLRSINPVSGFISLGSLPVNTNSYADSVGLNPSTTYYYRIRAIYAYGGTSLVEADANWKLNNNYTDASTNIKVITPANNPVFDAADKMEGTHSLVFNGTNQYVDVATTSSSTDYIRGSYDQKTVAFWMRSNSNTGNRIVVDLGGSDDGLSVRLDANNLYAGIASNNVRRTINVAYNSSGWNHVALVYNYNTFRLYLNGTQVASNTNLGFTSVGTTSNASRIGTVNSSNAFNTGTGFFNGKLDNFGIYSTALSQADISALMNNVATTNATTNALPVIPAAPTVLTASGSSTSSINVSWADNATTELNYELYRSGDNNGNYVKIATLPANTNSFIDNGLFAGAIYYYRVLAKNLGGNSGFSNEDSSSSFGHLPLLAPIENQYMRFDTQLQLNIQPEFTGSGAASINVTNLPAFATFTPNGNGTAGVITFNPGGPGNQGTYPNITVTATNANSGSVIVSFQLVVNSNYSPVIAPVSNVSVNEAQTTPFNITATDQNVGDVLSWSFTGLPSFAAALPSGNSVQVNLTPGYADKGVYNVTARVQDQNNGFHTRAFVITVNDVNPNKKIFINFTDGSFAVPAPWNSTNKQPALNDDFAALKDETGTTTTVGLQITTPWQNMGNGSNNLGVNTGSNSGVYPDNVTRSAYWSDVTQQNVRIYGLDVTRTYNFTFFGSRGGVTNNRTTNYTVKGVTVSLNAASNSQNTVSITNVQPDPDGSLVMNLKNGTGSTFAYLNAMVIESLYDDGSAPVKPKSFAVNLVNGRPALSWEDAAYNESAYEVYRATNLAGPYTNLTPGGNNAGLSQYADNAVNGNTTYYYYVRATNSYGNSPVTETLAVTTGNGTPVLNTIADVKMKTQQIVNINLTVTDDAGDVITFQSTGLPSFATLTNNGNGTGVIHIEPGNTMGNFNGISITARDDKGASVTRQFNLSVSDKDITSIYVNFTEVVLPLDAHWNSTNGVGYAGKTLPNLLDETVTATGVTLTVVDGWEGANDLGAVTGNNSGVLPDNVMKTVYYESSTNVKRMRLTGLTTTNKYNLVFFASRSASDNRTTTYSANGISVSLNAANNTTNTVQINGLTPDATGMIEFTAVKAAGSSFAYFGALVIQSYVDNGIPITPANLTAIAKSKTTIQLNWNDKSGNEDGFEIYRSQTIDGAYALIFTTAANVTSYLDAGLNGNSIYYYKVRAKRAPFFFSAYSNIAGASPYTFSVFINFNRQNNAAAPWNNTARAPELGRVFTNQRNDLNNPTGLDMTIVQNFSGDNTFGVITGNNSGVFPDNVLRSSWWVDFGIVSQLKISNLNHTWAYSFVFTGSRDGGGDRTSVYTINGKSVSLNASFNSSQTVQIDNVQPDANGEVFIDIALGQYAQYAYLNGMVIHGYQLATSSGGSGGGGGGGSRMSGPPVTNITEETPTNTVQPTPIITNLGGFPNPFTDHVTVSAKFESAQDNLVLRVIDISGKIIMLKSFGNVPSGQWNYRIDFEKSVKPGIYFLQIQSADNRRRPVTFKLVKTK